VYGASAITAVTAQNTVGITSAVALAADLVSAQIEAVAGDFELHATKTGMLATTAIVEAVAAAIAELDLPQVVVDPVMVATSGERLLDPDAVQALRRELLPRALVVTPNLAEAAALAGCPIETAADGRRAAACIREQGPSWVLITGGHREGTEVVDLLFDGAAFTELRAPRIEAPGTHGTGCAFASALAAQLALGRPVPDAAARAQRYVGGALRRRLAVGRGRPPLDHFWGGILKG